MKTSFKMFRFVLTLPLCFVLISGCALRQSGSIHAQKYVSKGDGAQNSFQFVGLYNGDDPKATGISKGDYISVRLKRVYVANIPEIGVTSTSKFFRGEVAVIAKVFEEGGATGSYSFKADSLNAYKLIYFSDDVLEKQQLNLSNLPMYTGKYDGNPLGFQLAMVEIDTKQAWVSGLLSVLADAGKKSSPQNAALVSLLNDVAQSILKMNTDDIMFKYDSADMPKLEPGNPPYPLLQPGDYVFVRKQNRSESVDWKSLEYVAKDGLLWQGGKPLSSDSYIVVSVLKSSTPFNNYTPSESYKDLVDSLKAVNSEAFGDLRKSMDVVGVVAGSIDTYQSIDNKFNALLASPDAPVQQRRLWATSALIDLEWAVNNKENCGKVLAGDTTVKMTSTQGCLSDGQIRQLVKKANVAIQSFGKAGCTAILGVDAFKTAKTALDCLCSK